MLNRSGHSSKPWSTLHITDYLITAILYTKQITIGLMLEMLLLHYTTR